MLLSCRSYLMLKRDAIRNLIFCHWIGMHKVDSNFQMDIRLYT